MSPRTLALLCATVVLWQPRPVFALETVDFDNGADMRATLRSVRTGDSREVPGISPKAVMEKSAAETGKADWTLMEFINGKNNLERFAIQNVNAMEAVGSNPRLNVVVELGTMKGSKRMLVAKDDKPREITSATLQDLGKTDMGDWRHLAEFGIWAKKTFPAKRYMLIIWNHGSGWIMARGEDPGKGISYDDETSNHISPPQLAQALAAMGGVDVYASDACLMQMAEVAYQLKDQAGVVIGSEEVEQAPGYNYTDFLRRLAGSPGAGPEQVAQAAVDSYRDGHSGWRGGTQSSLRTESLKTLAALLDDWTSAVMRADDKTAVKSARQNVQAYYYPDNIDLADFVRLVMAKSQDATVKSSGARLLSFVAEKLVAANAATGNYAKSGGLAVYLPKSGVNKTYEDLAWAKESRWLDFARWAVGTWSAEPRVDASAGKAHAGSGG